MAIQSESTLNEGDKSRLGLDIRIHQMGEKVAQRDRSYSRLVARGSSDCGSCNAFNQEMEGNRLFISRFDMLLSRVIPYDKCADTIKIVNSSFYG